MKADFTSRFARPWGDSIRTRGGRRAVAAILLLTPLALVAGLWLEQKNSADFLPKVTIDRSQALEAAYKIAKENGYDASTWEAVVSFERSELNELFLEIRRRDREARPAGGREAGRGGPRPPEGRKKGEGRPRPPWMGREEGEPRSGQEEPRARRSQFAPPIEVTVLLVEPDKRLWNRVRMGVDGFITLYEAGGVRLEAPSRSADGTLERQTAEAALKEWLGDMALERLGEPEASLTEETSVTEANRFVWRAVPRGSQMVEMEFTFDVAGDKILKREVRPRYTGAFLAQEADPVRSRRQFTALVETLLVAGMSLYALYRYTRRTIEKEAPHARVAALACISLICGLAMLASDPHSMIRGLRPEDISGPLYYAGLLLSLLFISIPGLILGLAYGSGEGEIREMYPAKLTSLDCLLKGKVLAQNVGAAATGGVLTAVWIYLLFQAAQAAGGSEWQREPSRILSTEFGRFPWLKLLTSIPLASLLATVAGLLVPLTFLRRHVRNRRLLIGLLFAAAMVGSGFSEGIDPKSPADWLLACALTTAVLIPFFLMDYLANVVSVVAFKFLYEVGFLHAVSEYWRQSGPWLGVLAFLTLAPFLWAAWRGRKVDDRDVRPAHARNLMQRLSFEAEMRLAREAQRRLLPLEPPNVEGFTIAASCTPSGGIGGDFFDFFRLPGNQLGVVLAEGGDDGLASALTIGMVKGFLMYESEMPSSIEETMRSLEKELGQHLGGSAAGLGLGLILADPREGRIQVIRTGNHPEGLVLRAGGGIRSCSWKAVEGTRLEYSELMLDAGDVVLLHTDGLPKLAQKKGEAVQPLFAKAGAARSTAEAAKVHEDLLRLLLGQQTELEDDLTLVVLHYSPTADQRGERAA